MDYLHEHHNAYRPVLPDQVKPDWMTDDEWQELRHISGAYNFYD